MNRRRLITNDSSYSRVLEHSSTDRFHTQLPTRIHLFVSPSDGPRFPSVVGQHNHVQTSNWQSWVGVTSV